LTAGGVRSEYEDPREGDDEEEGEGDKRSGRRAERRLSAGEATLELGDRLFAVITFECYLMSWQMDIAAVAVQLG
jgi:hypothetical protein